MYEAAATVLYLHSQTISLSSPVLPTDWQQLPKVTEAHYYYCQRCRNPRTPPGYKAYALSLSYDPSPRNHKGQGLTNHYVIFAIKPFVMPNAARA